MSRYIVFAASLQHARVDFLDLYGLREREVILVTGPHSVRNTYGVREGTFVYLPGWWWRWNAHDAAAAWYLQYVYQAKQRVEPHDLRRQNFARDKMGLPRALTSYTVFDPSQDTYFGDRLPTDPGERVWELRAKKDCSFLPGLDDKKRTLKPFDPIDALSADWDRLLEFAVAIGEAQGRAKGPL